MVAIHGEHDAVGQCTVLAIESDSRWEVAPPNVVVQRHVILLDRHGGSRTAGRESYEVTVVCGDDGDARATMGFGELAVYECISVDAFVATVFEIGLSSH